MKHKMTALSLFTSAFLLVGGTAQADPSNIDTGASILTQLTDYQAPYDSLYPAISKDGSTVVFVSDADLTGEGTNLDSLHNVFVMNADGSNLRQLTFATLDPTHLNTISYKTKQPQLSADGSVVVFASTNNLTGNNPPEAVDPYYSVDIRGMVSFKPRYQIFIMNTDGTGLRQLTNGTGGDSIYPDISNAGDVITFQSNQDLIGKNVDQNDEIYVIKADGSRLSQITAGVDLVGRSHDSRDPNISGDGSTVAFDSYIDLIPGMNDDLSDEIFVFDLAGFWRDDASTDDYVDYTVQITNTDIDHPYHVRAENAFEPTLSYDGTWVAFAACINPDGDGILDPNRTVLGKNPFLPDVLYIAKRDGTEMTQLTFSDDGDAYADDPDWTNNDDDIQRPQISDDGRRIVFASRSRVDIVNPEGNFEIAMIDLDAPNGPDDRPVVEQITYNSHLNGPYVLQLSTGNTDGYKLRLSTTGNANKTVFRAEADFTSGNPDENNEVFMVEPKYLREEAYTDPSKIPVEETPTEETTEEESTEEGSTEEESTEEESAEETPVEETTDEESAEEEIIDEETPVKETAMEESPLEETPVEDTLADEAAEDETPAENIAEETTPAVQANPVPVSIPTLDTAEEEGSSTDVITTADDNSTAGGTDNGINNVADGETGGAAAFGFTEALLALLCMGGLKRRRR